MMYPTKTAESVWTKLVRIQSKLLAEINDALKKAGLPPLTWYDVLLELDRSDGKQLRQYEIGEKILLPKHNLSRLIDRLEAEGLVERLACEEDGRGNTIQLTQAGSRLCRKMWPVYGAQLDRLIDRNLSADKLSILANLLGEWLGNMDE